MGIHTFTISMATQSQVFERSVSQFESEFRTLPKNVWTIRKCLSQVVEFCDDQTHSRQDDRDENWMCRKDYYNKHIGWTIPSWEMLSQIKSIHKQLNTPICDYGSGSGLLSHLLKLMDCDVYGVDRKKGWKNVGKFHRPDITVDEEECYPVPSDHIFLISWGYLTGKVSPLNEYVEHGGKCVIIIGEDNEGCTYPSYDYLSGASGWVSQVTDVPNFYGIYTKMSINTRQ
jgi:hypothetical protein